MLEAQNRIKFFHYTLLGSESEFCFSKHIHQSALSRFKLSGEKLGIKRRKTGGRSHFSVELLLWMVVWCLACLWLLFSLLPIKFRAFQRAGPEFNLTQTSIIIQIVHSFFPKDPQQTKFFALSISYKSSYFGRDLDQRDQSGYIDGLTTISDKNIFRHVNFPYAI